MNEEEVRAYLLCFDPGRDENGWVVEPANEYAKRMRATLLPHWPAELLIEWLHRHNTDADRYVSLGFENLRFHLETWEVEKLPGREAFFDPTFFDNFTDVERRSQNPQDWLARYMMQNGTWPTPIVMLQNSAAPISLACGERLKRPYHLLEGHRRMSFLGGLRDAGKAKRSHSVWIATYVGACET